MLCPGEATKEPLHEKNKGTPVDVEVKELCSTERAGESLHESIFETGIMDSS